MNDPNPADLQAAMARLVSTEPALPAGSEDIERRGRRLLAQRRATSGVAAALVLALAGFGAVQLAGGQRPGTTIAQPPGTSTDDPSGSQLASGFPVGSAVDALAAALPAGVSVAQLPMDIGWRAGGHLDVPVGLGPVTGEPPAPTHLITIQVNDGTCVATVTPSGALSQADLDAIAAAVCTEWVATGSLPVIPAGPPGEEQPDLAAQ
jgi:hypothetical protein